MVKPIKPVITILKNDEYQVLLLGVTLLAFLLMILFFSRYYYKKNYNISEVYDTQTDKNISIIESGDLSQCTKGECVINIDSGLKKCPSDVNTVLFYKKGKEVCTNKNTCPTNLPYAVNSDGSVNIYGTCQYDKCRCTDKISCAHYVSSKFAIVNGALYSSFSSDKNYLFEQVPFSNNDNRKDTREIDPTTEYCKINSTYANDLVGGCSFQNQINDFLMDCSKEELNEFTSISPYSLDPFYLSTSGVINKQFCEIQPYLDSNWNNMTLCINKNPCKIGNLTYNFDKYRPATKISKFGVKEEADSLVSSNVDARYLNSRNFCQSYASNLDTYLTDLQYYTLSCIGGTKCNELPSNIDQDKFFGFQNQELDVSLINASYEVEINNDFILPRDKTYINNPFINKILSGDVLKINNAYYILRVNNNKIKLYSLKEKTNYLDYEPFDFSNIQSTDSVNLYPQYSLNGFGYNVNIFSLFLGNIKVLSFNIENSLTSWENQPSSIPSYIPLYSILKYNTFFRAAVSKPAGFVFKQDVQEEQVEEDLTQQLNPTGFSPSNYKIKKTGFNTSYYNNISFYYPVWNNQYGKSECIRCTPLLVASINMKQTTSDKVQGFKYDVVTIQSSGKDFGHYRKNFLQKENVEKIWCYESVSNINPVGPISTVKKIYLQRPNLNIQVGDYILSSHSELNFTIKSLVPEKNATSFLNKNCKIFIGDTYINNSNEIENYSPFYDDGEQFIGLGQDDNTYQNFQRNLTISCRYSDTGFSINNISGKFKANKGFLFGNKFKAVFSDLNINEGTFKNYSHTLTNESYLYVTIVPSVQVKEISANYDVITTEGYSSTSIFNKNVINKNSTIQFISLDRNLYLNNDKDKINNNLPGSGGEIKIDKITNGRISSIEVSNPGTGYMNASPLVRLESYDPYFI